MISPMEENAMCIVDMKVEIEATVEVRCTSITPGDSGMRPRFDRMSGNLIDPGSPPTPDEIDFELYAPDGTRLKWLEDQLSDSTREYIVDQIVEELDRQSIPQ